MSTGAPLVSVVISVHNGARYLRAGIGSVLAQQGVDFEVIVIDDGSTDQTPAILAEIAAADPRVRVITQANMGLTRSLIRGCAEARGKYVARHDGDDLSLADRFRLQVEMLESRPDLVFASCWAEVIGPAGEPLLTHRRPVDPDDATHELTHRRTGPPGHGSVMFRREAYERVGGYRSIFYYAQDSDLWLRLATVGKVGYVQQVLYQYRISAESISGSLHESKLPYARLIDELHAARQRGEDEAPILERAQLPLPGMDSRRKSSADATLYFIGRCLFGRRDPRASAYLRACLLRNPGHLRAWALWPLCEIGGLFWKLPAPVRE